MSYIFNKEVEDATLVIFNFLCRHSEGHYFDREQLDNLKYILEESIEKIENIKKLDGMFGVESQSDIDQLRKQH